MPTPWGATLLVQTVEKLTALRIDHFAVIDFAGFRSMVDAVGGIDVEVVPPVSDTVPGLRRGMNHLNGDLALLYVRDRSGIATGERARRQQNALRAMLDRAASSDIVADPVQLYDFLDAASRSMGVDEKLSNGGMRALALKISGLQPAEVLFVRAPVASFTRDGAVQLDAARTQALWTAIQQGVVKEFVQQNGRDALGSVVR